MADTPQPEADENWWRGAVIYQVYPRSFADSNGDGTGDLAGVRSRLPYLAELGVNALWFSPWYPSPMADGGYDVADYRDVEPVFGSLAEAEKLISEAVALGIRTIIDVVPNHISAAHPWFREALAASPGSPARERFWFRPGRGEHGELPPNNWPSQFGGPAWTRTTNPDGTPGDWFLNLFDSEQPDLNWNHPDVVAEHEDILRFWFDRGAGGVRIDSAAMVAKDPALPDLPDPSAGADAALADHPYVDRDDLHGIYRGWRRIADSYPGTRILVGEVWLPDAERFARYLRPDEMHTAFNFDFLACPWEPARLRTSIDVTLAAHAPVSAPATWVLCNHDVTRTVTRYGREDTGFDFATKAFGVPTDLELGTRRARAAALLTLALPGSVYLYQGEELGLPEVEDIPTDRLQDPMYLRSPGTNPGRDGCRVPLPWSGDASPFGFSPPESAEPWLPQPAGWAARTAEIQSADPASMLSLYRAAIRLRGEEPALAGDGPLEWLDTAPEVLAFRRPDRFVCLVNLGDTAAELPEHQELLLTSGPLGEDSGVPQDTAVWLRV
ncbi:alpha-glucosidase [Actinacidiphila yanglinensis]|uniref:Alpha-glucosidase n=1 Tax=Actinacidiphila yanglinensis TaxID=310779 RepID=A0A1H5T589_9ACTN|nr:glycoside hydrolase family 13 protein [Actinacidiphila yanglinensis]SEF57318.1 alpha-glucosidase [Actinacidiphila yanglinensis]